MSYYFARCSTVMHEQKYVEFLLEHYQDLNLPYSFPISLSFIASPLLMEDEKGECFLCFSDQHEVIGALGYIYGTGENQYQDTHLIQIQIVYFREEYRKTTLFLHTLQFLIQYIAQLDREVKEFRFWTPANDDLQRLFTKIADKINSLETAFGPLDEYHASFSHWYAYANKFRQETYF